MPGLRDQLLSTGVTSLAQLIGHGVRLRRSSRALPDIDDTPHKEALANADRVLSLSARWSLDPSSIEELADQGQGIAGELRNR